MAESEVARLQEPFTTLQLSRAEMEMLRETIRSILSQPADIEPSKSEICTRKLLESLQQRITSVLTPESRSRTLDINTSELLLLYVIASCEVIPLAANPSLSPDKAQKLHILKSWTERIRPTVERVWRQQV